MIKRYSGPENPNRLKLVPGVRTDNPETDFPRPMSVTGAAEAGKQILRLVQPLEPAGEDKIEAWRDLGGGNLWAERVADLKDHLQSNLTALDEKYNPLSQRDIPIYKLQQAMFIAKETIGQNDNFVNSFLLERAKIATGTKIKRDLQMAGARDYDSLSLLGNAFKFACGDDELKKDQFMDHNCPSPMWRSQELRELVLQSIDLTHRLLGEHGKTLQIDQKARQSFPERFIKDLRDKYLETVIQYSKPPRHGATKTQTANFRNHMADLIKFAWKDLHNRLPSDEPNDEHLFKD